MKFRPVLTLSLSLVALAGAVVPAIAGDAEILQLFEKRCASCHKDDETPTLHKGVSLDGLRKETEDVKGMIARVNLPADDKKRMPKSKGLKGTKEYRAPLNKDEIALIESLVLAPGAAPAFAGWALSPDALKTVRRPSGPSPTSSTIPQPTPQYEHTVRTCGVVGVVVTCCPSRLPLSCRLPLSLLHTGPAPAERMNCPLRRCHVIR